METDEHSIQSENNTTNITNNNSIQLNGTNKIDDKKDTDIPKPNVFDLIGGNKNCDTVPSDCNKKKTILNNNDVAIGFVDDDDDVETNGDIKSDAATNLNHINSDEATKGYENG